MRIDRLHLVNFRCFESRAFDLAERFTLLVGDNGKGKTAVLDALSVGAGAWLLGIPGAPARSIHSDEVRRASYTVGAIGTLEPQTPVLVFCAGSIEGQQIRWVRGLASVNGRTDRRDAAEVSGLAGRVAQDVQAGRPVPLPVISYYGTGRLWVQKRQRSTEPFARGSRFRGYVDCLDPASDAKGLLSWFKTYEFSSQQREQPVEVLEAVRQAVITCIPGASRLYYDPVENDLILEFEGSRLPFHLLSDGYRNMLAMAADVAYRCAVLNPQFGARAAIDTAGIVMIDEIDLHLHPKWQRIVVEALLRAFPRIQFVATTHSPYIIQSLDRLDRAALINLDGLSDDVSSKSIEDVSEENQGVDSERSHRFRAMIAAAEDYFRVLGQAESAPPDELDRLKNRLDELTLPFGEDPAYIAFLNMERAASRIDERRPDASG